MTSLETMKLKEEMRFLIEKNKLLTSEKESLSEQLKMEKAYNKIDNILNKEKYDHMYDTALQISKDYLKFVEDNQDSDESSDMDLNDDYDAVEDISKTLF